MGILFLAEELIIKLRMPQQNFTLLPAIPIFFTVFGIAAIKLVYEKQNSSVAAFMGVKMAKILLSLMFILIYVFLIKENSVSFLVSYLVYFLSFLIFETWMVSSINKKK